jgi:plasmid stabilization system protein ParE
MDFKVIFKETFLTDLESVLKWIAAQNPVAARKLGERIVAMAESLSFFPQRYPRLRQRPQIRRFSGSYQLADLSYQASRISASQLFSG